MQNFCAVCFRGGLVFACLSGSSSGRRPSFAAPSLYYPINHTCCTETSRATNRRSAFCQEIKVWKSLHRSRFSLPLYLSFLLSPSLSLLLSPCSGKRERPRSDLTEKVPFPLSKSPPEPFLPWDSRRGWFWQSFFFGSGNSPNRVRALLQKSAGRRRRGLGRYFRQAH